MEFIFEYPSEPVTRRHGPRGYADAKSFKPWLRDEFGFRCVYCLWRERWYANGDAAFGVEHLRSRMAAPSLVTDYENLVYACCRCNAIKTDTTVTLDPCRTGFGHHLRVDADGVGHALSPEGAELMAACKLDAPLLTESRRRLIQLMERLKSADDPRAKDLLGHYLGLPTNLPRLAELRPPQGNSRPGGISQSFYERSTAEKQRARQS